MAREHRVKSQWRAGPFQMKTQHGRAWQPGHPPVRARWPRLIFGLLLAAMLWQAAPMLSAGLVIDDWVFTATARWVTNPWSAFWTSHFYEPLYFRPVGVIAWWLVQEASEGSERAQFAVNLALHVANAAVVVSVLRALALPKHALWAGAMLVLLGPMALSAALWPSNRFDLLAVLWTLVAARLALVVLTRPTSTVGLAAWSGCLVTAVLACFSKESAYAMLGGVAVVLALARSIGGEPVHRGLALRLAGSLVSVVIGCLLWRHHLLTDAYAAVPADPFAAAWRGVLAWGAAAFRWFDLLHPGRGDLFAWVGMGLILVALSWGWVRSRGLLLVLIVMIPAATVSQLALAGGFAVMLNGEPLGTVTYARFFYAPWIAVSMAVAASVGVMPRGRSRLLLFGFVVWLGLSVTAVRALAERYQAWSTGPLRTVSAAAARTAEQVARASESCVLVFLDTAAADPGKWFSRFADATVKALAGAGAPVERCHVLTEMTPFLFILRVDGAPPAPAALLPVINPDGSTKSDRVWDGVRYRYRLPPESLASIEGARFFRWTGQSFVEVTSVVRSGERPVPSRSWGL